MFPGVKAAAEAAAARTNCMSTARTAKTVRRARLNIDSPGPDHRRRRGRVPGTPSLSSSHHRARPGDLLIFPMWIETQRQCTNKSPRNQRKRLDGEEKGGRREGGRRKGRTG